MRPVKEEHLKILLERNSILLLDRTAWTIAYIQSIVKRNPTHIATKKGNKTLSTDLWLDILDEAEFDENEHKYSLVYPVDMSSVQINGKESEPALVCNILEKWSRFGRIKDGGDVACYEVWLKKPLQKFKKRNEEEEIPENPFQISTTVLPDKSITIPVSDLDFELPFLHRRIKAPDVISWVEGGACGLCRGGERNFCVGCRDGREVLEKWTSLEGRGMDCGTRMVCPLCIGKYYAETSARETSDYYAEMPDGEYEEFRKDRYRELGYAW
ncbi:hypothetical protein NW752_006717 [Fusarium irregulare]|uniref:Uncharacterized protein n=1 Tax=Fusarium irregulare TaxID=2494466 RepID=A0A9W8PQZ5_9HYPO|nr:hypothetical protein NW766_005597 [Fusarium irregulare]KAJ4015794.1 hypothetical protein NW752_006717 [Fusarium irregulare]